MSSLSLSTLKPKAGSHHRVKRIGRGNASGHGTSATRGTKGQRARQGGRKGLGQFGVKHFISRLPKSRGFQSFKLRPQVVTLSKLANSPAGTVVDFKYLVRRRLIANGKLPVKIIGNGPCPAKLNLQVNAITPTAQQAVESAGGTVTILS